MYVFSDSNHILNTLSLVWGVNCFYYDKFTTTDETIYDLSEILKKSKVVNEGDVVINTGSMPLKARHRTNMMKITVID